MVYEIAGLKVEMQPQFSRLRSQCQSYRSSGIPVITVKPDPRDMSMPWMERYPEEEREYICCSAAFCRGILAHGRFFLHASAVVSEDWAYLFSAPSGTGKSTHTALWTNLYPGSYILNDDKPVIWPDKGRITAWGTPFSGKSDLQVNRGVPLKGICFLKQAGENRIRPVPPAEALALLLGNTWRPENSCDMARLLDMIGQVAASIPVYELSCTQSAEAAKLTYAVMKGM